MTKYDPKAAERLKNSRLMKPVKLVWAVLVVLMVSVLAGTMSAIISGNPKVFFAWLLCVPFSFVVMPGTMGLVNAITGVLLWKGNTRKKREENRPNQASHATSEPAPGAASSSREC